jgi:hypothetical protein
MSSYSKKEVVGMKHFFNRTSKCSYVPALLALLFTISLVLRLGAGVSEAKITGETIFPGDEPGAVVNSAAPNIQAVMAVQDRHTHELLATPEVVGTATGLTEAGRPAILVFTRREVGAGRIPETLEGVPVVVKITGEILSMRASAAAQGRVKNTATFTPPVPIGVSTGNIRECSAGTISARVKDGAGNIFALSNNHVYALENSAPIGSAVLQPGLYDTQCLQNGNNVIGTLYDYVTINFGGGNNTVDAAIAASSTGLLGNATPPGGYGTPGSATIAASLNQAVQKYGRTTSLTRGTITGINATVNVSYSTGTATFVNQIVVSSNKPFIKPGDSGSLLVTDDAAAHPVGLLFAGNANGSFAVANQIGNVLASFGVTIDGK